MAGDAPGASPAAALQPWTEMAAAFESHRACGDAHPPADDELVARARGAAAAAAAAPRWFPKDGASAANDGDTERAFVSDDEVDADDDQSSCAARREDLAEGLRDVAAAVGPDVF